jgi:hypothetical protein
MKLISMLHKILPLDTLKPGKSIYYSHPITPSTARSSQWPCLSSFSNIILYAFLTVGRDSAEGIATRRGLDGTRIESRWAPSYSAHVRIGPEVHPTSCTMGIGSFPGLKLQGVAVEHPPYLVPRLKREYSYRSTLHQGLRGLF